MRGCRSRNDRPGRSTGWLGVVLVLGCGYLVWLSVSEAPGWTWLPLLIGIVVALSLVVVPPGQSRVVLFFGRYIGSVRSPGFALLVPLTTRKAVSIRVRNFETNPLKVNDADGNPVEIAAIVVWQVADTAKAVFAVDDYDDFVPVQSESALRHVATTHPYDDAAGERHVAARLDRRGRRRTRPRGGRAGRGRRGRDHRGADQPPGVRPGDRPGDAATPAGRRRRRRPLADRRRRGGHGGDGARPAG